MNKIFQRADWNYWYCRRMIKDGEIKMTIKTFMWLCILRIYLIFKR